MKAQYHLDCIEDEESGNYFPQSIQHPSQTEEQAENISKGSQIKEPVHWGGHRA